jgi:putative FmdB family regulatory protein
MPVYTYECDNGHRFESKQGFNDAPLTICTECGSPVHRVIQPVGVVFKGSGFYVTDSRGKQNLATAGTKKDDSKSGNGSGDSASTTTETTTKTDAPAKPAESTKTSTTSSDSK